MVSWGTGRIGALMADAMDAGLVIQQAAEQDWGFQHICDLSGQATVDKRVGRQIGLNTAEWTLLKSRAEQAGLSVAGLIRTYFGLWPADAGACPGMDCRARADKQAIQSSPSGSDVVVPVQDGRPGSVRQEQSSPVGSAVALDTDGQAGQVLFTDRQAQAVLETDLDDGLETDQETAGLPHQAIHLDSAEQNPEPDPAGAVPDDAVRAEQVPVDVVPEPDTPVPDGLDRQIDRFQSSRPDLTAEQEQALIADLYRQNQNLDDDAEWTMAEHPRLCECKTCVLERRVLDRHHSRPDALDRLEQALAEQAEQAEQAGQG